MMRITREEEHYIGRARPGILARVKVGFRKDGRITAIDMYAIQDNGPYDAQGDARSAGDSVSLAYQPETMRWRGLTVLTNTPPKASQRAPGGMQGIGIMEPIIVEGRQAARHRSGRDPQDQRAGRQGAVRRRRCRTAGRHYVTSAFVREALDKGRELFNWEEKKALTAASGRARRCAASASRSARTPPARSASTACSSSSPTAAFSSSRASATSARIRCSTCTAWRPRCSTCRGSSATSSSATRRRTCRGPASRPAARRRTR